MTVTGLTTINISILTAWQQAILYFLMTIGNITFVSIIMVLIRRRFFRLKFDDVIKRSRKARKLMKDVEEAHQKEKHREYRNLQKKFGLRKNKPTLSGEFSPSNESPKSTSSNEEIAAAKQKMTKKREKNRKKLLGPLRADMIRRMDGPAVLINQAGMPSRAVKDKSQEGGLSSAPGGILISEADLEKEANESVTNSPDIRFALPDKSLPFMKKSPGAFVDSPQVTSEAADPLDAAAAQELTPLYTSEPIRNRFDEATTHPVRNRSGSDPAARAASLQLRRASDAGGQQSSSTPRTDHFPQTHTVEFSEPFRERDRERTIRASALSSGGLTGEGLKHRNNFLEVERFPTSATTRSGTSRRDTSNYTGAPMTRQMTAKERGFGGFPTPFEIATSAVGKAFPKVQATFTRTTTMPRTTTFTSMYSNSGGEKTNKPVPYLTFDATVSRNSRFQELTETQKDELGGVEYRAIDLLAKLLPAYYLGFSFFFVVLVAPWLASSAAEQVHEVLATENSSNPNTTWMWFFNVASAYSNTGLSLIDTSMSLLPTQYMMLIPIAILILVGNTAFPIFLRFFIWCISKVVPRQGRLYETLRFLLDHPRRCFVYLFPSGQTWFLFGVLLLLNCTDWIAFQVLDIGNPTIESWSVGQRIFDGLFQSIAVRAAGFQIISLLTLAPAVQFLYIVMMYISAYPIAMSVRNTNVYEERSLGLYNEEPGDAAEPQAGGARVWGKYLAAHARRQLAFDIWWLGFSLWLVCIVQRHDIQDPTTDGWFTVFNCLFELTSAYGTVGLSTGTPVDNFSFSGRFNTLGKLVVIAVMLRGRHRGLPVAIDRAVLLPGEMDLEDEEDEAYEEQIQSRNTMTPAASGTFFQRSGTGYSGQGIPRMSRDTRELQPTVLDLDATEDDDVQESEIDKQDSPLHVNHYPQLSAIQESSPSHTPAMSRAVSQNNKREDISKEEESLSSSSSSSSKGKKVESTHDEKFGLQGGSTMEQLPSAVDSQRSGEERLDELERK